MSRVHTGGMEAPSFFGGQPTLQPALNDYKTALVNVFLMPRNTFLDIIFITAIVRTFIFFDTSEKNFELNVFKP